MNSWLRLPNHSWPCSTGSSCPAARRSVAFAALFTPTAVEALRVLFLEDLLARPLTKERQRGELLDRTSVQWEVFDIDGTRGAARQRALPKTEDLPPAQRRLDAVGAAGYTLAQTWGGCPYPHRRFAGPYLSVA